MSPDRWLAEHGHVVQHREMLGGGCISRVERLRLAEGGGMVLKSLADAPNGMFAAEAEGLAALREPGFLRAPEPLAWGDGWLLLEDLGAAPEGPRHWQDLGRALARTHRCHGTRHGWHRDGFCGATPQPNPWTADGHAFFAEHRLRFQADRAHRAGLLPAADRHRLDRLCERLRELIPAQPPSPLHGDLWSGNAHAGLAGPAVLDPAFHFGWAEADLAMTALFGGFPAAFYAAYEEANSAVAGWRDRAPALNLYHLLNHLNLFGRGYLGQVQAVLARW